MLPTRTPLAILAAAIVSCPWRMLVAAAPAEGDELGVEHPAAPSSCSAPPHQRASCFTQTWDHQPQLVPSGASTDGPLVGNGDMGAVAAGQPGTISLFTGKNDFWGVRDVPNGGCPYTIMSGAWVTLTAAGGRAEPTTAEGTWTATQDMQNAIVNVSTAAVGADAAVGGGPRLDASTFMPATTNAMVTRLTVGADATINVTLSIELVNYDANPFETAVRPAPGPGRAHLAIGHNIHRRLNYASVMPCSPSTIIHPSVRSIALTADGILQVTNGSASGCLVRLPGDQSVVHQPDGRLCAPALPGTGWKAVPPPGLSAARGRGSAPVRIRSIGASSAVCLTHGNGTPTDFGARKVWATDCESASTWVIAPNGGGIAATDQDLFMQPSTKQCLTAAPPNFNNTLAQALMITGPDGATVPSSHHSQPGFEGGGATTSLTFSFKAKAAVVYTVVLSSISQRDADGADPAALAESVAQAAAKNVSGLAAAHAAWWAEYWAAGAAVDLGRGRLLLEGWWWGSQYIFGSATRAGKVAPGLWGPWVTGGRYAGWNGDYTIDYNFQANFWGAASSNRPGFMAPYFASMRSLLDIGERRARSPSWHDGQGNFGPSGQYSQGMQCGASPTGWKGPLGRCPTGLGNYSGVNFPGHFGPYPDMYFPTDMGIRSIAAFAWTPLMQYYESVRDRAFLEQQLYPYLRGIVDFYMSYFERSATDGRLHVPQSCGDEICHYEDGEGLDPMEDLAFARMALQKAIDYSAVLGVDDDVRPQWRVAVGSLADYPTTTATLGPPPGPPGPTSCARWHCTCQGLSDLYGTNAGTGWGCAPPGARSWYQAQKCRTKSARYPCLDPPAPCAAPGCKNALPTPANNSVPVFAQSRALDTGRPLPGVPYVGYPIVYDAAIHPGEVITRNSEPGLVETARNTVWVAGLATGFNPTNGFVLSWIPASRIVHKANASRLLDLFTGAVAASCYKSFYHPHGGGGYEDVGAVEAVNSMLLASTDGVLELFPAWPAAEAASFRQLRAYGAFIVSAQRSESGVVSAVEMLSEAGATAKIRSPWPAIVVKTAAGANVATTTGSDSIASFETTAGTTYVLSCK